MMTDMTSTVPTPVGPTDAQLRELVEAVGYELKMVAVTGSWTATVEWLAYALLESALLHAREP